MKKMNKIIIMKKFKIIIALSVVFLLFIISCNDTTAPPKNLPKEITAVISGTVNITFESAAFISLIDLQDRKQVVYSGPSKINNTDYGLVISLFFFDKIVKTGTYNFVRNSTGITNDYAVGAFTIGKDANKREFISDSGTITITEIHDYSMQASFNFVVSEQGTSNTISVKNGIINVK